MICGQLATASASIGTGLCAGLPGLLACRLLLGAGSSASLAGSGAYMADLTNQCPQVPPPNTHHTHTHTHTTHTHTPHTHTHTHTHSTTTQSIATHTIEHAEQHVQDGAEELRAARAAVSKATLSAASSHGTSHHRLCSNKMALITSDCGKM